jgi:4-amino-4-deoxy-L-arabinose transferase-like glycosyltransferase
MQMNGSRSSGVFWVVFTAGCLILISAAAIVWSLHHPFGVQWDEAQYLNEASIDTQRLQHGMLLKLGGRLLIKSWGRPPAYRLLALPFLVVFGFHTAIARLTTLACFVVSSFFVYLATRRIAGRAGSGLAVLLFCLSPVVVSASIWFSTEGPLYLATSAMFYYLFAIWTNPLGKSRAWVGLGVAIGLGLLSKASFLAVMVPLMLYWLVAGLRRPEGRLTTFREQVKATLLALIVAGPWWLLNFKAAAAMAAQARGFVPNSLGAPSVKTWMLWFGTVCTSLLGYGAAFLICLVFAFWIYRELARSATLDPVARNVVLACLCAGAPIAVVQLTGTNHLLRHISPALIPFVVVVGVLADQTGIGQSRTTIILGTVLLGGQLLAILYPVIFPNKQFLDSGLVNASLPWRVMTRSEQWNWDPLLKISHECGVQSPVIAYLGMGSMLNPPQIERPWAAAVGSSSSATFPYPDVRLLWRFEQGPLDWKHVMLSADRGDIVVTAPHYVGDVLDKDEIDNRYNTEFAERLSLDPLFQSPISFVTGRFEPLQIQVFVKKSFSCRLKEGDVQAR